MKRLTLVTGGMYTAEALRRQMNFYFGTGLSIEIIAVDQGIPRQKKRELIVFSSPSVREDFKRISGGQKGTIEIEAGRALNMDSIARLTALKSDAPILFVNDHKDSAEECIQSLKEIGLLNLDLIPCAPPELDRRGCRYALTAGESHLVPEGVELLLDLGCRVLDYPSILKISSALSIDISDKAPPGTRYLRQIVKLASWRESLNARLLSVIEGLSEGMISYQLDGQILVVNEKAKAMLMEDRSLFGKRIQNVFQDKAFRDFLLNTGEASETVLSINGRDLLLNRIIHRESRTAVCRIKSLSEIEEDSLRIRELRKKGFYGKYTFEHILGSSTAIQKAKTIARKLAGTSLTILLEGASGTGKELMASAIHNHSPRRDLPFVAVNLSAVNEALLESELFGYEAGAFTGASRQGKPGLFEQADGGTLFLDEIGEISPAIQKGLLRVLQEGEVMRVGGSRIRKVDVRIIAATNRDLFQRIRDGKFREDLLYRIRQGYIRLPSLQDRKEDIPELIDALLADAGHGSRTVESGLRDKLCRYSWPGNIRELRNLLACMAAISESGILTEEDIPEGMFPLGTDSRSTADSENEMTVLKAVERVCARGRKAGRESLSEELMSRGIQMTPARIRSILNTLTQKKLIHRIPGTYGVLLTREGENLLVG
ncbi:MAG: sigma 54-interacting transcriptional regulator [Spirochaetales bacterium]|nr:sigma 54-interacting transcriptional regulator [Spirochaetales bacterium]